MVSIILSRKLTDDAFATYNLFQITLSTISMYSAMGLGITASKHFSEMNNGLKDYEITSTLFATSLVGSVALAALIVVVPFEVGDYPIVLPKHYLALGVLILGAGIIAEGGILGLEKYRTESLVSLFCGVLLMGLVYSPVVGSGYDAAITIVLVASAVLYVGKNIVVMQFVGLKNLLRNATFRWSNVVKVLSLAGPMSLVSAIAGSSAWTVGQVILNANAGGVEFSRFTVCLQWYSLGLLLPNMISRVVLPMIVRLKLSGDEGSNRLVEYSSLMSIAISAILAGSIFLLSDTITALYGSNLGDVGSLVFAYMVAAIVVAPSNTVGNSLIAMDGHISWLYITIVQFALTVGVAFAFRDLGAISGAYGIVVSALFSTSAGFLVYYKLRKTNKESSHV